MNTSAVYKQIRQTVHDCLPGARILLFGSRARGDGDSYSDYDLLIITPETFTPQEKIKWSSRLDRAIVKAIKAPVDLLLNSEEEVSQKQELPGHIIRLAVKEGIAL
jgi:predicted nucleotidyltransferase